MRPWSTGVDPGSTQLTIDSDRWRPPGTVEASSHHGCTVIYGIRTDRLPDQVGTHDSVGSEEHHRVARSPPRAAARNASTTAGTRRALLVTLNGKRVQTTSDIHARGLGHRKLHRHFGLSQSVPIADPLAKTNDLGHVLPTSRPAYRDRVADWTGVERNTADLYLGMAVHELHGVSPSYEALCRAVAGSQPTCALLDNLPQAKRQPNLLLGAVRFLAGPVDDPASFLNFVTARWGAVADTMMAHRTQTNEPGRCATLLPLLVSLPQPLALVEVGASAGLCLYPDRYSYRYSTSLGEHRARRQRDRLVLRGDRTGPAAHPATRGGVAGRTRPEPVAGQP